MEDMDTQTIQEALSPEKEKNNDQDLKMIQQELSELKKVLDEKESDVKSLEIKIKELEKLKRDQKREIDKLQVEAQKVQKEYEKAKDKATELFEQNTMLKEEVKTHQSTAIADSQIKDMYEEVKKRK